MRGESTVTDIMTNGGEHTLCRGQKLCFVFIVFSANNNKNKNKRPLTCCLQGSCLCIHFFLPLLLGQGRARKVSVKPPID